MNLTKYKLGDLIVQRREKNNNYDVPIRGVSKEGFIPAKQKDADTSIYNVFYKYDFVFNPARMELNSIALNLEYDKALCSSLYEVFYVKDESIVLPEFLNLHIKRDEFARHCDYIGLGSAREYCRFANIAEFDIELPPIEVQEEIVEADRLIKKRIRLNNQMIQHLEATAQALYRKTFVDNIDKENLPKGWRMGTIEDLSEFVVAGVIPNYIEEGEYKVLGQRCVHDHIIDMSLVKSHIPKSNCLFVQDGDILINSTGSGTLGRVGQIISAPMNLAFDSNMTLVRPIGEYAIDYLGLAIFEKENYFVQISQGSTSQTRLYCSMVKPAELLIPSMDELEKFKNYVHPMRNEIEHRRFENEKLTELQSLLLAKMGQ